MDSEYWLDALFEESWAYFMTGQYERALGNIHSLQTPYFSGSFYPESLVLKAFIHFEHCRYRDAATVVGDFLERHQPIREDLVGLLRRTQGSEGFFELARRVHAGEEEVPPRLEPALGSALGDRTLLRHLAWVRVLDEEERRVRQMPDELGRSSLGARILQDAGVARSLAVAAAGDLVRGRLQRVLDEIVDLTNQATTIQIEILAARRRAISGPHRAPPSRPARPIAADAEHLLWPFNGEVWSDEVGTYQQVVRRRCAPGCYVPPVNVPAPGARCAAHPESPAVGVCTRCGSFYCAPCTGYQFGREKNCVRCDPGGEYVAFEDRRRLGFAQAYVRTLKSLLLGPDRFFHRMPASGGFGGPLLFAWLSWALSIAMFAILYAVILGGMFAIMPIPGEEGPSPQLIAGIVLGVIGGLTLGIPPTLFVWSLILHVFAKIFGGKGTYEASFRCHAYASGALALGIVPLVGMTAGEVYWVVLSIFAVRSAHKVGTGRAAAIVLVIPVLCCGLYFLTVFGMAMGGLAVGGGSAR